ncbi:MAG: trypsin-like peptidase domain-containing protein [Pseudobdellovibrio sp.]
MKRISLFSFFSVAKILTLATLVASCAPEPKQTEFSSIDPKLSANVIYGSDGRLDLYQVTDERLKTLADSTVALVKTSDLTVTSSMTAIRGSNYGTEMNLCATERFREQDVSAFCSGTLVGTDTILTAGHCIETISDCQAVSFVFGFAVKAAGVLPKTVATSEVYKCKEIIKQQRVNNGADFAVIKLDRPVMNHAPLAVRPTGDVSTSDGLVVIGYPVGLPLKIDTGGTVRSISGVGYFVANLDTYGGNSGSAVLNASTGLIEGVLVRGEQDFVSSGICSVSKVCAEGACRGEDVTKISAVRPFLPLAPPPTPNPAPIPAPVSEIFTSNPNIVIPDKNAVGISNSLQVSSLPNGRKIFITISIKHSYIGDLVIKVTTSDGKSVILHQRAGGNLQNIEKSYEVTSQLGNVASIGLYKITVQDLAAKDIGTLVSWSVQFK